MSDAEVVIDGDAHINEPMDVFEQFLDDDHRDLRPKLITDTRGLTRILMDGKLYPDPRLRQNHTKKVQGTQLGGVQAGARDPIARLDDLDTDGIDVQVMYGSLGLATSTIADVDFAVAMARACNSYYASFCGAGPGPPQVRRHAAGAGHAGGRRGGEAGGHRARPRRPHGGAHLRRPEPRRPVLPPAVRPRRGARRADLGALGQRLAPAGRPAPSASTPTSWCTPSGTRSSR